MENGFWRKRRELRGREKDLVKGAWPGTRGKVVRRGRCSRSGPPPRPPKLFPAPSDLSLPQFRTFPSLLQVAMPAFPASSCVCLPILFLPCSSSHDHASYVPLYPFSRVHVPTSFPRAHVLS